MAYNGLAMHSAGFQSTSLSNVNKYKIEKLNVINPINPALGIAVVCALNGEYRPKRWPFQRVKVP
ncbi:hypothetical protein OB69_06945 [Roseivirga seohaensis subsp. aquiponti]|uniref:Uncharacterized protein n=1 Tax=Roseivirga seohaensis subsp. aquiponti TaxID=1566026 RepID=A0A0L8ALM1_9BACT|nr:hypothetical protein OB69_06945 [Roseivirga seohaensis subsp. aquiponti]